jgi:hypothetical protein
MADRLLFVLTLCSTLGLWPTPFEMDRRLVREVMTPRGGRLPRTPVSPFARIFSGPRRHAIRVFINLREGIPPIYKSPKDIRINLMIRYIIYICRIAWAS